MEINIKSEKGFIAITSSAIISALLLLLVVSSSMSAFFLSSSLLEQYQKELSYSLATGCAEMVLLRLSNDEKYLGQENIQISDWSCSVGLVNNLGNNFIFEIKVLVGKSVTTILVSANKLPLTIAEILQK